MLIYFTTGIDQVEETVGGLIMISTLFYYYKKKTLTFNNNNTVRKYNEKIKQPSQKQSYAKLV